MNDRFMVKIDYYNLSSVILDFEIQFQLLTAYKRFVEKLISKIARNHF